MNTSRPSTRTRHRARPRLPALSSKPTVALNLLVLLVQRVGQEASRVHGQRAGRLFAFNARARRRNLDRGAKG